MKTFTASDGSVIKPFDKVLMRDGDDYNWEPALLMGVFERDDSPFYALSGTRYLQCLPYAGNEYLLFTDETPQNKKTGKTMIKYKLKLTTTGEQIGLYNSKKDAERAALVACGNRNKGLKETDEKYISIFDFAVEKVDIDNVNEAIDNVMAARAFLGLKPNSQYYVKKNAEEGTTNAFRGRLQRLVQEISRKHIDAILAFNELVTIAEAWNKADGFEPDFSDTSQYKYFPWFEYSRDAAEFVYSYTSHEATIAGAYVGSQLCFKTSERAMQFGKQFIDLWNKVLLP